jgi:hypothetical protein
MMGRLEGSGDLKENKKDSLTHLSDTWISS